MPELPLVAAIAQTHYSLDVPTIEPLTPYCTEWRGLYRVRDANGGEWMVRMWRGDALGEQLRRVTRLLEWLAARDFPGVAVCKNKRGENVTHAEGWTVVILAYVMGEVLGVDPVGLGLLAQLGARLHTLASDADFAATLAPARCHPDRIAIAADQLARNPHKLPHDFQALGTNLHAAMLAVSAQPLEPAIVHGDCWYQNAIRTRDGRVVLIDWDLAGIGSPLLELGNLLLTSHFDFARMLEVKADEAKVQAILQGYQQYARIERPDAETLAHAMRFLLAYQLGSYVDDETRYRHPEFPFVLQKLQARYDATAEIARMAEAYLPR